MSLRLALPPLAAPPPADLLAYHHNPPSSSQTEPAPYTPPGPLAAPLPAGPLLAQLEVTCQ
eukprot:3135873-Rhodomonas_salina.1